MSPETLASLCLEWALGALSSVFFFIILLRGFSCPSPTLSTTGSEMARRC